MSQSVILAVVHGHEDKSEFMLCGKAESLWDKISKEFSMSPSGTALATAGGAYQAG